MRYAAGLPDQFQVYSLLCHYFTLSVTCGTSSRKTSLEDQVMVSGPVWSSLNSGLWHLSFIILYWVYINIVCRVEFLGLMPRFIVFQTFRGQGGNIDQPAWKCVFSFSTLFVTVPVTFEWENIFKAKVEKIVCIIQTYHSTKFTWLLLYYWFYWYPFLLCYCCRFIDANPFLLWLYRIKVNFLCEPLPC